MDLKKVVYVYVYVYASHFLNRQIDPHSFGREVIEEHDRVKDGIGWGW